VKLAQEKGIRSLGVWRLGSEDPGFWDVIRKQ
jgi:spore germination protein YaaH